MMPDGRYRQRQPLPGDDSLAAQGTQETLMHYTRIATSQLRPHE
jgi:hypothetical protein